MAFKRIMPSYWLEMFKKNFVEGNSNVWLAKCIRFEGIWSQPNYFIARQPQNISVTHPQVNRMYYRWNRKELSPKRPLVRRRSLHHFDDWRFSGAGHIIARIFPRKLCSFLVGGSDYEQKMRPFSINYNCNLRDTIFRPFHTNVTFIVN